eukprot:CAMPEP_0197184664 /NCGR_PEP_ID=MMETSP1423-20130617/10285_1 /TAXON_ID=476441 /ORGANISM="Pseudo-nitzschia heimii, Strain UNC1101" /LENGTH=232 /DNA_ID=CAMNT_0042635537 /DNA_START=54 /DNA_END=752 /DNA_ORIENTATION=+
MQKKLLKLAIEKLGPELIDIAKEKLGKQSPKSTSRPPSPIPPRDPSEYTNLTPIAPQHATSHPTDLSLKEKAFSFTGDNASVKDSKGNTMFRIQSELLTISQRRSLLDSHGNEIAQLRRQKLGLIPTVYIGTPENQKKVTVKTTGILNPLNCNASISIDGKKVGKVEGNWRAKKFTMRIDGVVIATIGRKRTIASTFAGADSYNISVNPKGQPVDLAFISLICIALDELYHD